MLDQTDALGPPSTAPALTPERSVAGVTATATALGMDREFPRSEWRGTLVEAIHLAEQHCGVLRFVSAERLNPERAVTPDVLAATAERTAALVGAGAGDRKAYTVGEDGTIFNAVTRRAEWVPSEVARRETTAPAGDLRHQIRERTEQHRDELAATALAAGQAREQLAAGAGQHVERLLEQAAAAQRTGVFATHSRDEILADRSLHEQFLSEMLGPYAPQPSPEALELAQTVLNQYGFRTGGLEGELAGQQLTADQLAARLAGRGPDCLESTRTSAQAFLALDARDRAERHAFFTEGSVTRTVDGVERTIRFQFDADSGRLAQDVGVPFDEAKAKVSWDVYRGVIDAAFATPGLTSLGMNGEWRPSYAFYDRYFAQSATFSGMSVAQREAAQKQALEAAGMKVGYAWSPVHPEGRGLDIDEINGVAVNRPLTAAGNQLPQPQVLREFSRHLAGADGITQVLQPWMMHGSSSGGGRADLGGGFWSNIGALDVEKLHRTHLHVTRRAE